MAYFVALAVTLTAMWLSFSGIYKPLLLSLGAVSIVICLVLAARLRLLDRETSPYLRAPIIFAYWSWLFVEILKANIVVIRACLRADLDLDPALVKVPTTCRSDLAKTVFANSITLTPGTVTLSIEGDKMLVHALYEDSAGPDAFTEMDRRSSIAADGRRAAAT